MTNCEHIYCTTDNFGCYERENLNLCLLKSRKRFECMYIIYLNYTLIYELTQKSYIVFRINDQVSGTIRNNIPEHFKNSLFKYILNYQSLCHALRYPAS